MRVGIDGIPLATPKTGIGHYTSELVRALSGLYPDDDFEIIAPVVLSPAALRPDLRALPANLKIVLPKTRLRRYWFGIALPMYISRSGIELFHGTNYEVPMCGRRPSVVTVHDLSLFLFPETHEERLVARAKRRYPRMMRRARAIITPTNAVRNELCQEFSISQEKIQVIPEAPRRLFQPVDHGIADGITRRMGIEGKFVLFVGTVEPRKNLVTLIRAFSHVLESTELKPQLVIAGRKGWLSEDLSSLIQQLDLADRITFTGYVSEENLRILYSSCEVCVYPSLYEGFGLPPLEAMACGAPVITSRIRAIEETVGEAAVLVDPNDSHALAGAIAEILTDPNMREKLSAAGLKRAAQFTWEETARQTMEVYRKVIGE